VRDSLDAINGIGHAAVITDPQFRTALAAHGFTVNAESGEVVELASFVGPFSARAAQIGRNVDRFEVEWRAANPGVEPGPRLRRSWDARAWAQARPDKVVPTDGGELAHRWVDELYRLGYRDPGPAGTSAAAMGLRAWLPAGRGDRPRRGRSDSDGAAGWPPVGVERRRRPGEVEACVARTGLVADPALRVELADDLTARVVATCVPLLTHPDRSPRNVPEHIRAMTSRELSSQWRTTSPPG
jgi:exodeoxyribonuclease V alpha subunit